MDWWEPVHLLPLSLEAKQNNIGNPIQCIMRNHVIYKVWDELKLDLWKRGVDILERLSPFFILYYVGHP